ncbi:MAG: ThuA domain-containing protein [Phycisphaerales bacterium]|nr:MAG: ThuA domain-containing protein [Phycisphaerales bacterium]
MSSCLSQKGCLRILGIAALIVCLAPVDAFCAKRKRPHVVFVTGDDEYRSEISMPFIAQLLSRQRGVKFRSTVLYAVDPETGERNPKYQKNIEGLEVLKTADVAVFFLRFRALPDEQLKLILDYVHSGKPIVGLRTSTHAFRYPGGHDNAKYNDSFGQDVFGQKWITHHGHRSTTDVWPAAGTAEHPILRGIYATQQSPLRCSSWLYHVTPLADDCKPLLIGKSINSNKTDRQDRFPLTQPVAWTKTYNGARVFFTTLGHPKDFEDDSVRRLLINGIFWALGMDVPPGGANVEARRGEWGWQAPDTH